MSGPIRNVSRCSECHFYLKENDSGVTRDICRISPTGIGPDVDQNGILNITPPTWCRLRFGEITVRLHIADDAGREVEVWKATHVAV